MLCGVVARFTHLLVQQIGELIRDCFDQSFVTFCVGARLFGADHAQDADGGAVMEDTATEESAFEVLKLGDVLSGDELGNSG